MQTTLADLRKAGHKDASGRNAWIERLKSPRVPVSHAPNRANGPFDLRQVGAYEREERIALRISNECPPCARSDHCDLTTIELSRSSLHVANEKACYGDREAKRKPGNGIPNAIAKQGRREPCCADDPDQQRHQEYIARRIDRLSLTGHQVCASRARRPERRLASRAAEVFEPELRFANHRYIPLTRTTIAITSNSAHKIFSGNPP